MLHAIADFAEVANLRKALVANLNVSVSQTVASHQPVSLLTSVVPDERYCVRVHSGIY